MLNELTASRDIAASYVFINSYCHPQYSYFFLSILIQVQFILSPGYGTLWNFIILSTAVLQLYFTHAILKCQRRAVPSRIRHVYISSKLCCRHNLYLYKYIYSDNNVFRRILHFEKYCKIICRWHRFVRSCSGLR